MTTRQKQPSHESATSRLMGANYRLWALDWTGGSWLSPFGVGVCTTAQAIAELDELLALPIENRPFSLQGAS